MSTEHNAKIGRVNIPIFAIITAIPAAIKAANEAGAGDREASSPGGSKVTPGEVLAIIAAFVTALGEAVAPAILSANGLD